VSRLHSPEKEVPGFLARALTTIHILTGREGEQVIPVTYPSNLNPVLHHPGPVWGLHAPITKANGHHTGGHIIELDDGGTNSGCVMLIALLVLLAPNGAQVVVGHHVPELSLRKRIQSAVLPQTMPPGQDWSPVIVATPWHGEDVDKVIFMTTNSTQNMSDPNRRFVGA
jgi:hypothetical protein